MVAQSRDILPYGEYNEGSDTNLISNGHCEPQSKQDKKFYATSNDNSIKADQAEHVWVLAQPLALKPTLSTVYQDIVICSQSVGSPILVSAKTKTITSQSEVNNLSLG